MNIESRANEIVENYQKERLIELWSAVESWKKCGCHKCSVEADRAVLKFYDEYYFINERRHIDDKRTTESDYEISEDEFEDLLATADIKEIEIKEDITEEELTEYFLSLKFKDTLVCFKYCGAEIWIYYDKDGRPEEFGDKS